MKLLKIIFPFCLLFLHSASISTENEGINTDLVNFYKEINNGGLRERHITLIHRIKGFFNEEAQKQYAAATQAQEELDKQKIEELKKNSVKILNTLNRPRHWLEYIFTPKDIKLAQQAQKELDALQEQDINTLKKEDIQYHNFFNEKPQNLIVLAQKFDANHETLPANVQNALNSSFIFNHSKFPIEGIKYLLLKPEIIKELNIQQIEALTEKQLIDNNNYAQSLTNLQNLNKRLEELGNTQWPTNLQNALDTIINQAKSKDIARIHNSLIKFISPEVFTKNMDKIIESNPSAGVRIELAKKFKELHPDQKLPENLQSSIDSAYLNNNIQFPKDGLKYVTKKEQPKKERKKQEQEPQKQSEKQLPQENKNSSYPTANELQKKWSYYVNDSDINLAKNKINDAINYAFELGFKGDLTNPTEWKIFYRKKAVEVHTDKNQSNNHNKIAELNTTNDTLKAIYEKLESK